MRMTLATLALTIATQANAQSTCMPYQVAMDQFAGYKEEVIVRGLVEGGALMEVWANVETGTWTLIAVTPDGLTCPVVACTTLETYRPKPTL